MPPPDEGLVKMTVAVAFAESRARLSPVGGSMSAAVPPVPAIGSSIALEKPLQAPQVLTLEASVQLLPRARYR